MDQCIFCSSRGDIKKCENTFCSYHDSWYAETLLAKLEKSEQRVKALEEALLFYADKENYDPYPRGHMRSVSCAVEEDQGGVARKALEATCQK